MTEQGILTDADLAARVRSRAAWEEWWGRRLDDNPAMHQGFDAGFDAGYAALRELAGELAAALDRWPRGAITGHDHAVLAKARTFGLLP